MLKFYLESLEQLPIFENEYLNKRNISYYDHFNLSFTYAKISLRAGYYFIINAFFPGKYPTDGQTTMKILKTIIHKY
jgi:hypothetical protein